MLTIEVEFLTGVSVAASPFLREEPEWPPHPDRLFQALVAAWGRDETPADDERRALEWLEGLDPAGLTIKAPAAGRRDTPTVFVPPNDARTTGKSGDLPPKKIKDALLVLPDRRTNRQARTFPAVIPFGERPMVRYTWTSTPEMSKYLAPLQRLAKEVTYIGHSHTLVRVSVSNAGAPETGEEWAWLDEPRALRVPHVGRLEHLQAQYARSKRGDPVARPIPSNAAKVFRRPEPAACPSTLFDPTNLTVFVDAGGFVPSLSAFPLVALRLRDSILASVPRGMPIPPLLSGHDRNGNPTDSPHIAVLPLADVGWPYSEGRLMGLFVAWPKDTAVEDRRVVVFAIASFLSGIGRTGLLHFGPSGSWAVRLDLAPEKASLATRRYVGPSRIWGTVLPALLDRHPKDRHGRSLPEVIIRSLLNVGLPKGAIEGVDVEVHKTPLIRGAPTIQEVGGSLPTDSPYRGRPLAHLLLTFERPIQGPLLIGAGRYRGLGLCMSLTSS